MTQILEKKFEVNHGGTSHTFQTADYMRGLTKEILTNEDRLVDYLRDRKILLPALHTFLQQDMVNLRAIPRKTKNTVQIPMTKENIPGYQAAISSYLPKLMPDPDTFGKQPKEITPEKALETLLKGMTPAEIMAKIAEMQKK
jgi:hypothetical protein